MRFDRICLHKDWCNAHLCMLCCWDTQNWLYILADNLVVVQCNWVNMSMHLDFQSHDIVNLDHKDYLYKDYQRLFHQLQLDYEMGNS